MYVVPAQASQGRLSDVVISAHRDADEVQLGRGFTVAHAYVFEVGVRRIRPREQSRRCGTRAGAIGVARAIVLLRPTFS